MDTKKTAAFHIGCIQGAAKGAIFDLEFVQKFAALDNFDKVLFNNALTNMRDILLHAELAFQSHMNRITEIREEAYNNE